MKNIKFMKRDYFLILCISLFLSVAMSAFATQYDMSRYTILSPNNAVYYDLNVGNLYFDVGSSNIPTIEIGQRPAYRFNKTNMKHFLQDQTLYLPKTVNIVESIVLDREANNDIEPNGDSLNQVAIFNTNTLTIKDIPSGNDKGNPKLFLEAKKSNNGSSKDISDRQNNLSKTSMTKLTVDKLSTHKLKISNSTAINKLYTNALAINGKPVPSPRFGSNSNNSVYGPNNMEKKGVSSSKHYKGPWTYNTNPGDPTTCSDPSKPDFDPNPNFNCDNVDFQCPSVDDEKASDEEKEYAEQCKQAKENFENGGYSCQIAIHANNSITRIFNIKAKEIQVKEIYNSFYRRDVNGQVTGIGSRLKAQIPLITGKRTNTEEIIPIEGSDSGIPYCRDGCTTTNDNNRNKICYSSVIRKDIPSSTTPGQMKDWEGRKYPQSTMVKTYTLELCAGKEKSEDATLDENFEQSHSDFFENGDFNTTEDPKGGWLVRKIICNAKFPDSGGSAPTVDFLTLDFNN